MSVRRLPDRPNLDQLKLQAKELLAAWRGGGSTDAAAPPAPPRLRDAQRALAQQYGFDSWDALRAHVEAVSGASSARRKPREVLDYDDPVPAVVELNEPLTADVVERLIEQRVSGVKAGPRVEAGTLSWLAEIPTLQRIDLTWRADLLDGHLAFLEAMPWLTALSLARCSRVTDRAVERIRNHERLERINLQWTGTGDAAMAALAGKPSLSRVLAGASLTDAGVSHLRDFPALARPGAPDAFLAVSAARALTDEALAVIGTLDGVVALDLHMSAFGSPHYTARGVAHLARMASLQELNFHGALATDSVLAEIATIPRLRWLHCQDPVSGDEGFIALGRCTTLESVASRVCRRMTDRGFAAIARLPRLRSLGIGGPRVRDAAMAHLAAAPVLMDLGPIMFGDAAFEYIARIPRLERLTNMYNRSTGDAATRHLRAHPTLVYYGGFGTQITDESLRILSGLPRLETVELTNCDFVTDEGVRALAGLPGLRRVSVGSCVRVAGDWLASMPAVVDARHDGSSANYVEGYRAETFIDYPDLPIPPDVATPAGTPPDASGVLSRMVCFGAGAAYADEGLRLTVAPGHDPRWVGLMTHEAFAVPLRIDFLVKPVSELRLAFGAHNRFIALDDHGRVIDRTPWFMKSAAQRGEAAAGDAPFIGTGWTRVTLEFRDEERRLLVNGALRHVWRDDEAGVRSRIGIGVQRAGIDIRELGVETLQGAKSVKEINRSTVNEGRPHAPRALPDERGLNSRTIRN
jgi:hypothetical protein